MVLVKKEGWVAKILCRLRKLSALTSSDAYPMPRVDKILNQLGGPKYLNMLDLVRGYWQVPMDEDAQELTAFITPFWLYQFKVMPFRLSGAPAATFQRLMDGVVHGMTGFTTVYLDDLVILSQSWEEHVVHLRKVLGRLPADCQSRKLSDGDEKVCSLRLYRGWWRG